MYDTYAIMKQLEKEVAKKAESGIRSTADLEVVSKLAQAMKDFAKTEYYCTVTEAMESEGYSNDGESFDHMGGHSERRRRDSRGRYSRDGGGNSYDDGSSYRRGYSRDGGYSGYSEAKGDYMEAKNSYRSSRSPESKRDMETSLHDCMSKLRQELDEMESNADTREEREKIREMRKELAKLA